MGKFDELNLYKRKTALYRPISERVKDYSDVNTYLTEHEIRDQAARCMNCGIPFCHSMGCPLHNLIPEFNHLVYLGRWEEALRRLEMTNMLPEITGRICPALCEASCTLSIHYSPVTIKQIELAIIEKGFREGWVQPVLSKRIYNKKVAIIGSGPAGLAAAQVLAMNGYDVTVFERALRLGGILRYGIPDFKLEKWVIDRRVEIMKQSNIHFETDVNIGEDISYRYLRKRFQAILITIGVGCPRDLQIPGRDSEGILFALDYLKASNQFVGQELDQKNDLSAKDKNVIVIGGGDTGADCVGVANRQGAKKVFQFEIMDKPQDWLNDWNPRWPEWPIILRTSSSHEEGVQREWSVLTKEFVSKDGKLHAIHCSRVEWKPKNHGSIPAIVEIPGSDFFIEADLALLALGFVHTEYQKLLRDMNVALDKKENIKINQDYSTSIEGVFAAGDASSGASLVVKAIYQGRESAESIHKYLKMTG